MANWKIDYPVFWETACKHQDKEVQRIEEEINRTMNKFYGKTPRFEPTVVTQVFDKQFCVELPLPGVPRDRLNLKISGQLLLISIAAQQPNEVTAFVGKSPIDFSVEIPYEFNVESIDAHLNNGLLTVMFKQHQPSERVITFT